MSVRDIAEYGDVLKRLVHNPFSLSVAMNSLKFRFESESLYVWIDPSWVIRDDEKFIVTSSSMPDPEILDYSNYFQVWATTVHNSVAPISEVVFQQDGVEVLLENGHSLWLPHEAVVPDSWYDHWYVGQSKAKA